MELSEGKKALRRRRMIDALMGSGSADVVLSGGSVVDVLTREIYPADVALKDEFVLYVGDCSELIGPKTQVFNVSGLYVTPGLIDAHMHFESSMLTETEFSRLSIPHGTTTVFADPHEVGNVLGVDGMRAMADEARILPNRVFLCVPPLVPDLPGLETSGADVGSWNLGGLLDDDVVCGLGEMQGFSCVGPVYEHDSSVLDDMLVSVAEAKGRHKSVEGNAPGLTGRELAAHNVLCGGHASCHETTTKAECAEKLRCGYTVFIREGSTQRNLSECIRVVTEDGLDSQHLCLCTDDMVAKDLMESGHIDEILRRVVAAGVDPVEAIQMATINPATHYGRADELGALAPGRAADVCVMGSLAKMDVRLVFVAGKLAARDGELTLDLGSYRYPESVRSSVRRGHVCGEDLAIASSARTERVRAVGVVPEQNLTKAVEAELRVERGVIVPSVDDDVLAFDSIERHGRSNGRIGRAFVHGMTLSRGAIAQTIGHDTHNLIVCGASYEDMAVAANRVIDLGGGIAMACAGRVVGELALPVAGLMTDELAGPEVASRISELEGTCASELGCSLPSPFMHLSFLTLSTSPDWKLSDRGIIDVNSGSLLDTLVSGKGR